MKCFIITAIIFYALGFFTPIVFKHRKQIFNNIKQIISKIKELISKFKK